MAARAGVYCAIHTVMADDEDFRALSPHAKLVVYTLKMILGPSGIDVVRAFEVQMQELTGLGEDDLLRALDEVMQAEWVRKQGTVVWLRNALRFNPSITMNNQKHRDGVLQHLRSLPAGEIVNAFAKYYDLPEIIPGMGTEWVSHGYGIQDVGCRKRKRKVDDSFANAQESAASAGAEDPKPNGATKPPTFHQQAMPVLRELGYAADKHDGSILREMAKKGIGWEKLEPAVRGLAAMRERGELRDRMGVAPGEQLSMRILYARDGPKNGARPIWNEAADRWYQKLAAEQRNERKKMPRLAI